MTTRSMKSGPGRMSSSRVIPLDSCASNESASSPRSDAISMPASVPPAPTNTRVQGPGVGPSRGPRGLPCCGGSGWSSYRPATREGLEPADRIGEGGADPLQLTDGHHTVSDDLRTALCTAARPEEAAADPADNDHRRVDIQLERGSRRVEPHDRDALGPLPLAGDADLEVEEPVSGGEEAFLRRPGQPAEQGDNVERRAVERRGGQGRYFERGAHGAHSSYGLLQTQGEVRSSDRTGRVRHRGSRGRR